MFAVEIENVCEKEKTPPLKAVLSTTYPAHNIIAPYFFFISLLLFYFFDSWTVVHATSSYHEVLMLATGLKRIKHVINLPFSTYKEKVFLLSLLLIALIKLLFLNLYRITRNRILGTACVLSFFIIY